MHVGDLDGTSTNEGQTWTAVVTAPVYDNNHNPLANVLVSGSWSVGDSAVNSCDTNDNGQYVLLSGKIPKKDRGATFAVLGLTGALDYKSAENHDPDGGSPEGSIVTVNK